MLEIFIKKFFANWLIITLLGLSILIFTSILFLKLNIMLQLGSIFSIFHEGLVSRVWGTNTLISLFFLGHKNLTVSSCQFFIFILGFLLWVILSFLNRRVCVFFSCIFYFIFTYLGFIVSPNCLLYAFSIEFLGGFAFGSILNVNKCFFDIKGTETFGFLLEKKDYYLVFQWVFGVLLMRSCFLVSHPVGFIATLIVTSIILGIFVIRQLKQIRDVFAFCFIFGVVTFCLILRVGHILPFFFIFFVLISCACVLYKYNTEFKALLNDSVYFTESQADLEVIWLPCFFFSIQLVFGIFGLELVREILLSYLGVDNSFDSYKSLHLKLDGFFWEYYSGEINRMIYDLKVAGKWPPVPEKELGGQEILLFYLLLAVVLAVISHYWD